MINNKNSINNDYVSLTFSGISIGGVLRSWTANDRSSSVEPANLRIRCMVFSRTKNHRTLVDRLTREIIVGVGYHFA